MDSAKALSLVLFIFLQQEVAHGIHQELFTTNAVCSKRHCVNPVFPGLEDLHTLSHSSWRCSTLQKTAESMGFCRPIINYDPALPAPGTVVTHAGDSVEALTQHQDGLASTAFFYHMAGLGYEGWDYQQPELSDDECVKSIWRMVCYTYFPRAQMGCVDGGVSLYMRPCQSSCQNYVRQCGVECCDESVQCVFTHEKVVQGATVFTEGYAPHDGPSSFCTGSAHRRTGLASWFALPGLLLLALQAAWACHPVASVVDADASSCQAGLEESPIFFGRRCATGITASLFMGVAGGVGRFLLKSPFLSALLIAGMTTTLQGCAFDANSLDVPSHTVGNWRAEPDYLINFEFVPPGGSARDARINSCALEHLSQTLQCSGRGICRMWTLDGLAKDHPTAFCECDRDFADPECRTKRKSQAAAFLLSLFLGFFGVDQMYLGFYSAGIMKFFTFGGFGIWWVIDVIRIGSAPVHTPRYRVAADLPHWAFVIMVVTTAMLVGFLLAYVSTIRFRATRRKHALLIQADEEQVYLKDSKEQPEAVDTKSRVAGEVARKSSLKSQVVAGMPTYGATRSMVDPAHDSIVT